MELSYLTHLPNLAAVGFPLSVVLMMFCHCLMGLLAAQIAYRKGADLGGWLLWGMIGGTVALVTALRMQHTLRAGQSPTEYPVGRTEPYRVAKNSVS